MITNQLYNIVDNIWPMILIFVIVISIIRLFSLYSHNQKIILYKEFISLIFIVYLLLLFELVTNTDMQSFGNNFIPFKEILRYELFSVGFYKNVLGNILLFVPFGMCLVYFIHKCNFLKAIFITLITSYAIELVQSRIGRSYDIDDILLNLIGGIIGFFIGKLIYKISKRIPKIFKNEIFLNIFVIILTIITFVILFNYLEILEIF